MAARTRTVSLGAGTRVAYPEPTSSAATAIGKANRRANTKPEIAVRSALHRAGHRFRKDLLVRVGNVKVKPDIVFTRRKVAVFVDGCFWHGCPTHGRTPKSNQEYWALKLQRNVERDRAINAALRSEGWIVVRVWEHESLAAAVGLVDKALARPT